MRRLRWDRGPSPECDRHEPQYYICSAHERQDDSFDAIDDARQDKPEVDELCEWQVGRQRLVHFGTMQDKTIAVLKDASVGSKS